MSDLGKRIGARISSRRRGADLTQAELAVALQPPVETQTISRWERGFRDVSLMRLEQIAVVLKTTPDELLSGISVQPPSPALNRIVELLVDRSDAEVRRAARLLEAHLQALES